MAKTKIRRQRPIPGMRREFKLAGLLPGVADLVNTDAKRFKVTSSFVEASIVTWHYERLLKTKFEDQEDFRKAADAYKKGKKA